MLPRMAASVMTSFRRVALTMAAMASRAVRSGESMVGKWPSEKRRATLSSVTMRGRA